MISILHLVGIDEKIRSKKSRVLNVGIRDSDGSVDNGDIRFVISILHLVGIDEKNSVEKKSGSEGRHSRFRWVG